MNDHDSLDSDRPLTIPQGMMPYDVRVGTISDTEVGPAGLTRLMIDFGPHLGVRRTATRLSRSYTRERLVGVQVCAIVNPPAISGAVGTNEVLALGMPDRSGEMVLIRPDQRVMDGGRLF